MIEPVRCVACTKFIGEAAFQLKNLVIKQNMTWSESFEQLNIKRICCRTHLLTVPGPAASFVSQPTGDREMFAGRARMCTEMQKTRVIALA